MVRITLCLFVAQLFLVQILSAPEAKNNVINGFKTLAHGLRSGKVTLLDSKTIFIKSLRYDGAAPDAYFLVGKGSPSALGTKIPNEKGSYGVLEGYEGQDITLTLPGDITVHDIDYLSVYCVSFRENFGHITFPKDIKVPDPTGAGTVYVAADEVAEQPQLYYILQ